MNQEGNTTTRRPDTARSDLELVTAAQSGSRDAFGELVARHEEKTYGLCLKMLGNPEDAEDCVQEVFVKALEALPRFRKDAGFSTWTYRIATNACLMRLRKRRIATVPLDAPLEVGTDEVVRELPDLSPDPCSQLLNKELGAELARGIGELEEGNRVVFVLRVIHGLSTDDTAALLGISTSAVKSRLHRARTTLRVRLSEYERQ